MNSNVDSREICTSTFKYSSVTLVPNVMSKYDDTPLDPQKTLLAQLAAMICLSVSIYLSLARSLSRDSDGDLS